MLAKTQFALFAALMVWCLPIELQDTDIRRRALRAIEAARDAEAVQPYLLRLAQHDADGEQEAVIGAVYTPFLRVALAAAERTKAQKTLSLAEAEAILNENVFYAALRWRQDLADFDSAPVEVFAVPRNSGYFSRAVGVAPIWIAPGERAATVLGHEPLWGDVGAITAFPPELFSPDYDFVIFKSTVDPASGRRRSQHGRARIARADHARWTW